MPRLDGVGLVQRMRENASTADIPVIMLTAKGFDLSRHEMARKWGVLAVIPKPYSPRELLQRVNAVFQAETSMLSVSIAERQAAIPEIIPAPWFSRGAVTQRLG